MVAINEKIKNIRIEKNIKQSEVARSAKIKQPSYASIENGETKSISIEVGKGIAKALGVSFNELFEIDIPENSNIIELKKKIEDLENLTKSQLDFINKQSNTIDALLDVNEFYKGEFKKLEKAGEIIKSLMDNLPEGMSFEDAFQTLKEKTSDIFKAKSE